MKIEKIKEKEEKNRSGQKREFHLFTEKDIPIKQQPLTAHNTKKIMLN